MKQYGDITKLNGYELDPVDLIVGGSPCQDLSVAGKRAGLDGERSGLFMEMIRLIREMREKTNGIHPKFALWENVPGAFSSNGGADFQAVLTEFVRVVEPTAPDVPMPEEGWPKSGVLLGANWSIAWRTHDAQFWGVAQRRRRLSLIADFRGQSAWDILFEKVFSQSKNLSGNFEKGGDPRKGITGTFEDCTRTTSERIECYGIDHVMISGGTTYQGHGWYENVSGCLKTQPHGVISFQERAGKPGGGKGILIQNDHVGALSTINNQAVFTNYVRRLTPLECERLQGFPDGWTDIPGATDAKRYRALGNSIALPFWEHLAKRLVNIGGVQTIGSLFDGIGGFPLCFQRAGAVTLWTSEIEPFCEQVVKIRFGGEA